MASNDAAFGLGNLKRCNPPIATLNIEVQQESSDKMLAV